jgi:HAD superfamily hydrolase (TIGR01509 family)
MIKGFLLNLDGTLLDSNEGNVRAWEHAFNYFDYDITPDEIRTFMGMGADKMVSTLVPELKVDEGKGKELSEYRNKYFKEQIWPLIKPTHGARELLLALKRNHIRLVVSTSASKADVYSMLETAGVDDLVDDIVTASEVKDAKPAPDILAAGLNKIRLSHDEVYMLGDSPYDIASAKKNGIGTIAVRCGGYSDEHLQGAVFIFDNPKDLLNNLPTVLRPRDEDTADVQRRYLEIEK